MKWENKMEIENRINSILENMKSNFRTNDGGYTLIMYIGGLTFLKKSFQNPNECLKYVKGVNCNEY